MVVCHMSREVGIDLLLFAVRRQISYMTIDF